MTLKQLLQRTTANLNILEERKARQGSTPDLKLLNEIEDHRRAITLIQQALAAELTEAGLRQLQAELRPLLVAGNVEQINLDQLKLERPPLPFEPETILIPAGPFLMGSPPGAEVSAAETPLHQVNLPAYRIGVYPVTNAQYGEFIKQVRQQEAPQKVGWFLREPPANKLDHPVVGASWHDAVAYCRWLSQQTGRSYRLPTEAEWEKAARGDAGQIYPWGNEWAEGCCPQGQPDTAPVTAYPAGASPYGCLAMVGNVQQWTSTLWGSELNKSDFPYPYRPGDGREDLAAAARLPRLFRLHRGGSFRDEPARLRCSARGYSDPDSKIRWRGFRVVLETV